MTYGMQAVALIELGYAENATAEFKRSYANIQEPFDVWTGKKYVVAIVM